MELEMLLVVILSVVLGVLLMSYDRVLREIKRLRGEREVLEARGRFKANEIIQEAKNKALEIISSSQIQAGQSQEKIDEELRKIAEKQLENYKNMIQKVSISIEQDAAKEVSAVTKTVVVRTEEEFDKAKQQIEAYKVEKMAKLDSQIAAIAEGASKLLITKVLDLSNHQDLIMQALEEAKKDNVL